MKYKDKEIIIIHSYSNKSIVMDVKTTKTEYVNNKEIKKT